MPSGRWLRRRAAASVGRTPRRRGVPDAEPSVQVQRFIDSDDCQPQGALETIAADPEARVIVLAAEGRAFSAGHDLTEMGPEVDIETMRALLCSLQRAHDDDPAACRNR